MVTPLARTDAVMASDSSTVGRAGNAGATTVLIWSPVTKHSSLQGTQDADTDWGCDSEGVSPPLGMGLLCTEKGRGK